LTVLIIPLALVIGFQTLIILVPLLLLSAWNSWELFVPGSRVNSSDIAKLEKNVGYSVSSKFVSILIFMGTLLALFCEVFYIDDYFGKPLERMNTVFKLYMQLWILWGIAAGYGLFALSPKVFNSRNFYKIWTGLLLLLIVSSGVYPFMLVYARTEGFSGKPTLDGIEFMKKEYLPDYDAIYWINKNINGIPVILEAPGNSYSSAARISSYTGLPTIIGWLGHEVQWRNGWEEPLLRVNAADRIYDSNLEEAMILLKKYNVSYVYLGDIERKKYRYPGLKKFEDPYRFELVYQGVAEIYRVKYD
jgi:YYY domain-containing protein